MSAARRKAKSPFRKQRSWLSCRLPRRPPWGVLLLSLQEQLLQVEVARTQVLLLLEGRGGEADASAVERPQGAVPRREVVAQEEGQQEPQSLGQQGDEKRLPLKRRWRRPQPSRNSIHKARMRRLLRL